MKSNEDRGKHKKSNSHPNAMTENKQGFEEYVH